MVKVILLVLLTLSGGKENPDLVDMSEVVGYTATEYGVQLYFEDGSGYWLERGAEWK